MAKGMLSGKAGYMRGGDQGKSKKVADPGDRATGGGKMRGVKKGIAKSTTAPSRNMGQKGK